LLANFSIAARYMHSDIYILVMTPIMSIISICQVD